MDYQREPHKARSTENEDLSKATGPTENSGALSELSKLFTHNRYFRAAVIVAGGFTPLAGCVESSSNTSTLPNYSAPTTQFDKFDLYKQILKDNPVHPVFSEFLANGILLQESLQSIYAPTEKYSNNSKPLQKEVCNRTVGQIDRVVRDLRDLRSEFHKNSELEGELETYLSTQENRSLTKELENLKAVLLNEPWLGKHGRSPDKSHVTKQLAETWISLSEHLLDVQKPKFRLEEGEVSLDTQSLPPLDDSFDEDLFGGL